MYHKYILVDLPFLKSGAIHFLVVVPGFFAAKHEAAVSEESLWTQRVKNYQPLAAVDSPWFRSGNRVICSLILMFIMEV